MSISTLSRRTQDREMTRGRAQGTTLPYLYFAYGSNLNVEQMLGRCPTARPAGRLTLPNWTLEFRGVADIVPSRGSEVAGALYTLQPGDELALDQYEGYRRSDPARGLYRKVHRRIQTGRGRQQRIMFYVMNRGEISPPSPYYLSTIRQGYEDWGLPTDTLEEAVLRAVPQQDELTQDELTGSLFDEEWLGEVW